MMYEHHSNQSGDPNNVLVHALGHWRLTQLFHDLVFHPKVVVSRESYTVTYQVGGSPQKNPHDKKEPLYFSR